MMVLMEFQIMINELFLKKQNICGSLQLLPGQSNATYRNDIVSNVEYVYGRIA